MKNCWCEERKSECEKKSQECFLTFMDWFLTCTKCWFQPNDLLDDLCKHDFQYTSKHERLKSICNKIQYEIDNKWELKHWCYYSDWKILDEKTIIFNPFFMEKCKKYYKENINNCWDITFPWTLKMSNDFLWILENLHDPINYLENLLLTNKKNV